MTPALCPKCKIPPSNASDEWEYAIVCNNCFDADMVGDPAEYVSRSIVGSGNTMEAAIADWNERVEERTAT